jgi:hypothetical protein
MNLLSPGVKTGLKERLSRALSRIDDGDVEELPDDATLSLEVLFDIRGNTQLIIELLLAEEDDGQEESDDS